MQELIVDLFAGGGGASLGIERALGRGPDIAVNHDAAALTMHAANHPGTMHVTEDIWKAKPEALCGGKPEVIIAREPKEVRIRILVGECELCGRTCFGRRPLTCNCAVIAPTCIEANHKHRAEVVGECARLGATG